ncbi:MAG: efflux RND transporter permease subunit, partial [Verrucomicrobiia bacterium]
MLLSDISVKRPVFASVVSLLLVSFGLITVSRLPLREYPDIDPPVVSIETRYVGAAAAVVETRITEIIEQRIAGIEGISQIESSSEDGLSRITIEFSVDRDIDAATNDVRDRVAGIVSLLPDETDTPEIRKVDSNDDVVMWLNLVSPKLTVPELTDYARRYLVDRFSVLKGVARVQIGGAQTNSIRIWLDRNALAARNLTVNDVEEALRQENVELPAGSIESVDRQFSVRVNRVFRDAEAFASLVLKKGDDGYLIRLGDVARVVREPEETRSFFRGNGVPMIGLGIIKQSTANTLEVTQAAKAEAQRINPMLPEGMEIRQSFDSSIFVEGALREVFVTLVIAMVIVILVIYLFLGNLRATLIPAVTVPVSLVSAFIILGAMGFSLNLLTLLALVLAIGMVVDDAIVVLENIVRRMDQEGETPLVAAYRGARQVGFAVVATTLVLIAVFTPIAFLGGDIGRLFSEFAITVSAAVAFSSIVALTLSPMLCSRILNAAKPNRFTRLVNCLFGRLQALYEVALAFFLRRKSVAVALFLITSLSSIWLLQQIPSEYAPREDRGAFFLLVDGPEGATYDYTRRYMDEIERRVLTYVDTGEVTRLLVRIPRFFGNAATFNSGIVVFVLADWAERRSAWPIMNEVRQAVSDLPGVRAFPVMRQGFGARIQKPVRFVLGGGSYEELAQWRDILLEKIRADNPGLEAIDWDYKETNPQLRVEIDYDRAAELGVTTSAIGRTLETMLGSRRVTTYVEDGEEYDVILEGERSAQRTPGSLENLYVRSSRSGQLVPLAGLVQVSEVADASALNRFNRVRSITIEANLAEGYTLGEALEHLENLVREHLPQNVIVDYKGQSRDFKRSGP